MSSRDAWEKKEKKKARFGTLYQGLGNMATIACRPEGNGAVVVGRRLGQCEIQETGLD